MVKPIHAIATYSYHSWHMFSMRSGSNGSANVGECTLCVVNGAQRHTGNHQKHLLILKQPC
jgi:hypothetical protein